MNGAYDLEGVIWHQHSNQLMKAILKLWPDKNVPIIDMGCGHSFYVDVLNYAGYTAIGVDLVNLGHKNFIEHDVTKPLWVDLSGKSILYSPEDGIVARSEANIISLEVGEHIPANLSDGYLDNITAYRKDVIMSWALVDQPGHRHINGHTNEWVRERMAERGYSIDSHRSAFLRGAVDGCHCTWFANTLMYFHYVEEA